MWEGINHDPEVLKQVTITPITENHINQQKTWFELDKKLLVYSRLSDVLTMNKRMYGQMSGWMRCLRKVEFEGIAETPGRIRSHRTALGNHLCAL